MNAKMQSGEKKINGRKRVRHFSADTLKNGAKVFYVTYEDLSGHRISREEYERFRREENES